MKTVGLTHPGFKWEKNEDRYLINELDEGFVLLAVADGLGGEVAGEYAAETMIKNLSDIKVDGKEKEAKLVLTVERADQVLHSEAKTDSALEGMGTTVTAAIVGKQVAYWVHVGDSRLYRLRNKNMFQVTKDQNMAQFLLDEGNITELEAQSHPMKNLLEQCVGCGECKPVSGQFSVKDKDLIILSTDGLHRGLKTSTMKSFLITKTGIAEKAQCLMRAALDAGGKDNITIVIAEV